MIPVFKSDASRSIVVQDMWRIFYSGLMICGGIFAAYWMERLLRSIN